MSEIVLSCTCCGRQMVFPEECALLECPACSTRNARPRSTGAELTLLQRAVNQRLACDFHNAEKSYQHVLLESPNEHEALWGLVLCRYGVEYVEDPVTHRRMPTVHTVRTKPLQAQADFRYACEAAPPEVRAQYEADAAYIDDAQENIRRLAKSCEPYDVFLCHKTTVPGSNAKTEDYQRALELYYFLKERGFRVFFAPMSLQEVAGANYEAGIYHALQTAKVMLLFCSDADYLTSAWVRSEWSRFLDMMDDVPDKRLIPLLYEHFNPSELPQPILIRHLQGLDMSKLNASGTLLGAIQEVTGKAPEKPRQEKAPAKPRHSSPPEAQPEPPKPEAMITIKFPERLPKWNSMQTKKVKWFHYKLYKKGVQEPLSDIKWGETVQVPATDGDTLIIARRSTKRAALRVLSILSFLLTISVIIVLFAYSINDSSDVYAGICVILFYTILPASIVFMVNFHDYEKKVLITPRTRYEIRWNWNKSKLVVD